MKDFWADSVFFGLALTLLAYFLACFLQKKCRLTVFSPLLVSVILIIVLLLLTGIDYDLYYQGARYLSYLLTPATICLAIPLYEQLQKHKDNWRAIIAGVAAGVLASCGCVLALCLLFGLDHVHYVTLLPKSVTNAIGIGISEELGGHMALTVTVIMITGVLGNVCAPVFCRLARIREPIAKGIAIGSAAHAMGTSRAMEMGEVEGAMSSLALVTSGLLTVIAVSFFSQFV